MHAVEPLHRKRLLGYLLGLSVLSSALLGLLAQSWSLFGKAIAVWLACIGVLLLALLIVRTRESTARRGVEWRMADYAAFHRRRAELRARIEVLQAYAEEEADPWRRAVIQAALSDLHQLTEPYIEVVINLGELPDAPRMDDVEKAADEIATTLNRGSRKAIEELVSLVTAAKRTHKAPRGEPSLSQVPS